MKCDDCWYKDENDDYPEGWVAKSENMIILGGE